MYHQCHNCHYYELSLRKLYLKSSFEFPIPITYFQVSLWISNDCRSKTHITTTSPIGKKNWRFSAWLRSIERLAWLNNVSIYFTYLLLTATRWPQNWKNSATNYVPTLLKAMCSLYVSLLKYAKFHLFSDIGQLW